MARVLVISDVHSNLEALEAVLADAEARGGYDRVWHLGDAVGYGPDPALCIDRLRSLPLTSVAGNHDHAVAGRLDPEDFNEDARFAVEWTARQLDPDRLQWLASLPLVERQGDFTLVHGSLRDPLVDYLLTPYHALDTFARLETRFCLVGHSHVPFLCPEPGEGEEASFYRFPQGQTVSLAGPRWILNPGGVGQPRDGDPRAGYLLLDTSALQVAHFRVPYDVAGVQAKMRRAGLPRFLIDRLEVGY